MKQTINLDLVDQFQARFGEQAALEMARKFTFAYFSRVRAPLPSIAARNASLGIKSRSGEATPEECARARKESWDYIHEHKAATDFQTPEFLIIRGTMYLFDFRLEPGEPVSDALDWFLFMVNKFEDHSGDAESLIEKFFSIGGNGENSLV